MSYISSDFDLDPIRVALKSRHSILQVGKINMPKKFELRIATEWEEGFHQIIDLASILAKNSTKYTKLNLALNIEQCRNRGEINVATKTEQNIEIKVFWIAYFEN